MIIKLSYNTVCRLFKLLIYMSAIFIFINPKINERNSKLQEKKPKQSNYSVVAISKQIFSCPRRK